MPYSLTAHQTRSFYPRLREGGDELTMSAMDLKRWFLSTPPRGRRRCASSRRAMKHLFLSTPPRGRRPLLGWRAGHAQGVSIHASAREATCRRRSAERSISCFYPRLREGGDGCCGGIRPGRRGFYPRLREGGDLVEFARPVAVAGFYPRLREGGDPFRYAVPAPDRRFYPRLREGGDHSRSQGPYRSMAVSIHASAREATGDSAWPDIIHGCFYPRLREGGDTAGRFPAPRFPAFLSTPPRGRRPATFS